MLEGCCAAAAPLTESFAGDIPPWRCPRCRCRCCRCFAPGLAVRRLPRGLMRRLVPDAPRSCVTRPAPACARRSGRFSGRRSGPRHWNPQPRRSGLRGRAGVGEDGVDLPALTSWAGDQTLPCTAWQQVVFSCTSEAVLRQQGGWLRPRPGRSPRPRRRGGRCGSLVALAFQRDELDRRLGDGEGGVAGAESGRFGAEQLAVEGNGAFQVGDPRGAPPNHGAAYRPCREGGKSVAVSVTASHSSYMSADQPRPTVSWVYNCGPARAQRASAT